MSGFNFGTLTNTTGVASDRRLRPYTISKVKFEEAKVTVLHSEKNNIDYDVLNVRFTSDNGMYEENLFLPSTSGQDVERQPNNWGGENPSNADRALMFFAHCLSVLNNDGFKKLQKVVGQAKNFKEVATMVAKLLNEKKGIECYLKLVGRDNNGTIYASLPYYAGINKETHDPYVSNNFLSLKDDLGFTPSEDKKRQEYEKAKPTPMASNSNDAGGDLPSDNSDIDAATQEELGDLLSNL